MPNPGWLFFWIFSIILFVFLCFHHGSYDIEDITPSKFQVRSLAAPFLQSGKVMTDAAARDTGPLVANQEQPYLQT
jgi:hypothetical protein